MGHVVNPISFRLSDRYGSYKFPSEWQGRQNDSSDFTNFLKNDVIVLRFLKHFFLAYSLDAFTFQDRRSKRMAGGQLKSFGEETIHKNIFVDQDIIYSHANLSYENKALTINLYFHDDKLDALRKTRQLRKERLTPFRLFEMDMNKGKSKKPSSFASLFKSSISSSLGRYREKKRLRNIILFSLPKLDKNRINKFWQLIGRVIALPAHISEENDLTIKKLSKIINIGTIESSGWIELLTNKNFISSSPFFTPFPHSNLKLLKNFITLFRKFVLTNKVIPGQEMFIYSILDQLTSSLLLTYRIWLSHIQKFYKSSKENAHLLKFVRLNDFFNKLVKLYLFFNLKNKLLSQSNFQYFQTIYRERGLFFMSVAKGLFPTIRSISHFNFDKVIFTFNGLNPQYFTASFLTNYITLKLSQYLAINQIMKPITKDLRKNPFIDGFKITVAGRLTRKERAAFTVYKKGSVPLSTKTSVIDYSYDYQILRFGLVGVKTWLSYSEKPAPFLYALKYKFSLNKKEIKEDSTINS